LICLILFLAYLNKKRTYLSFCYRLFQ